MKGYETEKELYRPSSLKVRHDFKAESITNSPNKLLTLTPHLPVAFDLLNLYLNTLACHTVALTKKGKAFFLIFILIFNLSAAQPTI